MRESDFTAHRARLDPFGLLLPQTKWYNDDRALFVLGPGHPLREMGRLLATNPVFDSVVLVAIGEKQIRGSGGSPEPPAPFPMHLHTVYMEYSERLPTLLNPPG